MDARGESERTKGNLICSFLFENHKTQPSAASARTKAILSITRARGAKKMLFLHPTGFEPVIDSNQKEYYKTAALPDFAKDAS